MKKHPKGLAFTSTATWRTAIPSPRRCGFWCGGRRRSRTGSRQALISPHVILRIMGRNHMKGGHLFHVVFFQDMGWWVAQCLERNMVAASKDYKDLIRKLETVLKVQLE